MDSAQHHIRGLPGDPRQRYHAELTGWGCATIHSLLFRRHQDQLRTARPLIPAGVWTHIAVVWDTLSNTRKYYINGDLEYSGTAGSCAQWHARTAHWLRWRESADEFSGNIAEVRIWNIARSQDDIRHTMHEALQAPLPGLVADWHLSDDYKDSIGGFNGVPIGPVSLNGPQAPPQPVFVTIDKDFNTLPYGRYGAATVYLPNTNQALLIGGILNGAITNQIDTVDVSHREDELARHLPSNRDFLSAAYDPSKNSVYVFGGSDTTNGSTFANTIYAIDFPTGTVRTLAATLPTPAYGIGAVYNSQQKRIYLLGGYSGSILTSINVFDPQTETIAPASLSSVAARLSNGRDLLAAVRSHLLLRRPGDRGSSPTDTIYSLNFTSATSGAVTPLSDALAASRLHAEPGAGFPYGLDLSHRRLQHRSSSGVRSDDQQLVVDVDQTAADAAVRRRGVQRSQSARPVHRRRLRAIILCIAFPLATGRVCPSAVGTFRRHQSRTPSIPLRAKRTSTSAPTAKASGVITPTAPAFSICPSTTAAATASSIA